MNEQEEDQYYQNKTFSTNLLDNSLIPTSVIRHMSLIKANFQYLYHTTQQNWDFNWKVFFIEVLNSLVVAVILCILAFSVCSGISIQHQNGYTYDFWCMSFTIYACLIYITNVVIVMRSGQLTWFVAFWIAFFSVIPFLVVSLLFDTVMNLDNGSQYILLNLGSTFHYYLICIVMIFITFMLEFMRKFIQVIWKPRLADYFRALINGGLEENPAKFDKEFLKSFSQLRNPIEKHKLKMSIVQGSTGSAIDIVQDHPSIENPRRGDDLNKSNLELGPRISQDSKIAKHAHDIPEPGSASKVIPIQKLREPSLEPPLKERRKSFGYQYPNQLLKLVPEGDLSARLSVSRKISQPQDENQKEGLLPPIGPDFKKKKSVQHV